MSVKIEFDGDALRPLVHLAVAEPAAGRRLFGQVGQVFDEGSDSG